MNIVKYKTNLLLNIGVVSKLSFIHKIANSKRLESLLAMSQNNL